MVHAPPPQVSIYHVRMPKSASSLARSIPYLPTELVTERSQHSTAPTPLQPPSLLFYSVFFPLLTGYRLDRHSLSSLVPIHVPFVDGTASSTRFIPISRRRSHCIIRRLEVGGTRLDWACAAVLLYDLYDLYDPYDLHQTATTTIGCSSPAVAWLKDPAIFFFVLPPAFAF